MVFWIAAALLTLAASLAVLIPLSRAPKLSGDHVEHDLEVYRDQMAEVERDLGRNVIAPAEAEQARAEIGRRILRLSESVQEIGGSSLRFTRTVGGLAVLAVPLLSWGVYSMTGSPELPSQPLEARLSKPPEQSTPDELVARAERALRANPNDGKGWNMIAPIYQRLERPNEAIAAYRKAIELLGDSAERSAGLGVALSDAGKGAVSPEALAAFRNALSIEPGYPKARFFLSVAEAQAGRLDEAIAGWTAMVADLPQSSEWRQAAEQAVVMAGERKAALAAPAPTNEAIAEARDMPASDQSAMIEAMVASLDQKLRTNPADAEGWKRLVRSYVVLGKVDAARDALTRGKTALVDKAAADDLQTFATSIGLSVTE